MIAYIVLAHRFPEQVVRLIDRLASDQSRFYLHWDATSRDDELQMILQRLDSLADVRPVRRIPCHWGTYSILEATLEGVRAACSDNGSFDYLVLLSGQDYPIKPSAAIQDFFSKSNGRSYVHHVPFPKPDWDLGGWPRIHRRHYPPGTFAGVRGRLVSRWLPRRSFPASIQPHGGAQFWALSSQDAGYLEEFSRNNPRVLRFFKHVFVPDEIYIQSVMGSSPMRDNLTNDCLHFLEWQRPGNVLLASDLPSLRRSPYLFARKFEMSVDPEVFDLIDAELLA